MSFHRFATAANNSGPNQALQTTSWAPTLREKTAVFDRHRGGV